MSLYHCGPKAIEKHKEDIEFCTDVIQLNFVYIRPFTQISRQIYNSIKYELLSKQRKNKSRLNIITKIKWSASPRPPMFDVGDGFFIFKV